MRAGQPRSFPRRHGFTLVEAVVSMVIVAVMFVAAVTTVSGAAQSRRMIAGWRRADGLARALLAEMQACKYGSTSGSIAPLLVLGETPPTRTSFDEVDDYQDLLDKPPKSRDGVALSGFAGWQRTVLVERVDPLSPTGSSTRSTDKGLKRITITVTGPGRETATIVSYRSRWSFADAAPAPGTARLQAAGILLATKSGGTLECGIMLPNGPMVAVTPAVGGGEAAMYVNGEKVDAQAGGLIGSVLGILK